jgi:hypothetical protein
MCRNKITHINNNKNTTHTHTHTIAKMANPCPDGQVMDKTTKECRPPLKRGRKLGSAKTKTNANAKAKATVKSKKPCPDGQVMDKTTKECRPPLKRGRTAKRAKSPSKSPSKSPKNNATLDKYGFSIPVFKPKTYKDDKTYKQTTMLAFSKK